MPPPPLHSIGLKHLDLKRCFHLPYQLESFGREIQLRLKWVQFKQQHFPLLQGSCRQAVVAGLHGSLAVKVVIGLLARKDAAGSPLELIDVLVLNQHFICIRDCVEVGGHHLRLRRRLLGLQWLVRDQIDAECIFFEVHHNLVLGSLHHKFLVLKVSHQNIVRLVPAE